MGILYRLNVELICLITLSTDKTPVSSIPFYNVIRARSFQACKRA